MKKLFSLGIILSMMFAAGFVTSCSDDDDDDAPKNAVEQTLKSKVWNLQKFNVNQETNDLVSSPVYAKVAVSADAPDESKQMAATLQQLGGVIGGAVLESVLRSVEFTENNGISIEYADLNPDTIGTILSEGPLKRNEDEWKKTPADLCSFKGGEGSTVFVLPDIEKIQQIIDGQVKAAAADKTPEQLEEEKVMAELMQTLMKWMSQGVPLQIRKDGATTVLYINKAALEPVLKAYPYLTKVDPENPNQIVFMVKAFLDPVIPYLTELELGLNLQ